MRHFKGLLSVDLEVYAGTDSYVITTFANFSSGKEIT